MPKYDSARKKPPSNPDQNVYRRLGVEREVDPVELVEAAGQGQGVAEAHPGRHPAQQDDKGREHPAEDHAELVLLREVHRLAAAGCRVDDHDESRQQDGHVGAPAHHGREDDRRRIDGDPRRRPRWSRNRAAPSSRVFASNRLPRYS